MTPKQLKQIGKIKSIMMILWAKKGMFEFHYSDMSEIIKKHKGGQALSTSCVNVGLMIRPRKGYLKFCRKPNEQDGVNAYYDSLRLVRAAYFKSKEAKVKIQTQQAEMKDQLKPKIQLDEDYCIKYLKERGYKILRPIQPQFEEM